MFILARGLWKDRSSHGREGMCEEQEGAGHVAPAVRKQNVNRKQG